KGAQRRPALALEEVAPVRLAPGQERPEVQMASQSLQQRHLRDRAGHVAGPAAREYLRGRQRSPREAALQHRALEATWPCSEGGQGDGRSEGKAEQRRLADVQMIHQASLLGFSFGSTIAL